MRTPLILAALIGTVLLGACSPSSSTPASSPSLTASGPVAASSAPVQAQTASGVDAQMVAAGVLPENISALSDAQYDAIVKNGHGFQVGLSLAKATGFVFFDPQCPHCGHLWHESEPLRTSTNVRWMPVAFLNALSLPQGTALLAASDSAALMDQHEALLAAGKNGLAVNGVPSPAQGQPVTDNLKLLQASGGNSVPFLVHKSADGKVRAIKGELTTEQIKAFLNS